MSPDAVRVQQLLRIALLYLPGPGNSLYSRAQAGELATEQKKCGRCGGSGQIGRRIKMPCPGCEGKGELYVDGYTEQTAGERHEQTHKARRVPCDGCAGSGVHGNGRRCGHCQGSGFRLGPEDYSERPGGPERREWLERQGSFLELYAALRVLEHKFPRLYLLLIRVEVYQEALELTDALSQRLDGACELLAKLIDKPIRVPKWAQGEAAAVRGRWANAWTLGQRNEILRKLSAEGESTGSLARKFGITRRQVQRVLGPLQERKAA